MKVFGSNDILNIADKLDSDDELHVYVMATYDGPDNDTWLNKDGAIELIKHLEKVFKIGADK